MTARTAHGNGKDALLRAETAPVDELPLGVQAPALAPSGDERTTDGRFAPGSRTVQAQGGRAGKSQARLAARLGLHALAEDANFAPYKRSAAAFRRAQCSDLARTVGGGVCGPAPSSIVASASLTLAWSRYLSDRAALLDDPDLAMKAAALADRSRQSLLTAHELCAREALSRAKHAGPVDYSARILGPHMKKEPKA